MLKSDLGLKLQLKDCLIDIVSKEHNAVLKSVANIFTTLTATSKTKASTEATIPSYLPFTILPPLRTKIDKKITVVLALNLLVLLRPSQFNNKKYITINAK